MVAHREHGVECGHRILEDHGDVLAAHLFQFLYAHAEHVAAIQLQLFAFHNARRVRHKAQQRKGGGGFPRARFADKADGMPPLDLKIQPVYRAHDAIIRFKAHVEVFNI